MHLASRPRHDPLRAAWRLCAIYRVCLRKSRSKLWALHEVRRIFPDGSRDALVENWFIDMAVLQDRYRRSRIEAEAAPTPLAA